MFTIPLGMMKNQYIPSMVYENMYVLNGLGTRGVMIAPYVAQQLFDFIERKTVLNSEINSNRFEE